VIKALRLAAAADIDGTREWTGKLARHATSLDKPFSAKHEYLWEEFESALREGRKAKWSEPRKPSKDCFCNEQDSRNMEISAIRFEPS
jgi:hypothetical protein